VTGNWLHPLASKRAYGELAAAGWAGADLFFVLSGFLITGILIRAKGSADYLFTFFARRTLRIFPLYYDALVLFLVVLPGLRLVDAPFPDDLKHSVAARVWVYGLNLNIAYTEARTAAPDYLNHFWSLAVEEQFYLILPFLIWLTPKRSLHVLCGVAILFGVAYRSLLASRGQLNAALVLMPCRVDTLAIGGLLRDAVVGDGTNPTIDLEWAVRAPIVLIAMMATYLLYKGVAASLGRRAAMLGALVLTTCPLWLFVAHQTMTDMPFVGTMTAAARTPAMVTPGLDARIEFFRARADLDGRRHAGTGAATSPRCPSPASSRRPPSHACSSRPTASASRRRWVGSASRPVTRASPAG
jgi:peptidoglycan/LPS O-acetylase OafA/YrhL